MEQNQYNTERNNTQFNLFGIKQQQIQNISLYEDINKKLLETLSLIQESFKYYGNKNEEINLQNQFYDIAQTLNNNQQIIKICEKIENNERDQFSINNKNLDQQCCEIFLKQFCYSQIYLTLLSKCDYQSDSLQNIFDIYQQQQNDTQNLIQNIIIQKTSISQHVKFFQDLQFQFDDEFLKWKSQKNTLFNEFNNQNHQNDVLNDYNQMFLDIINQYKCGNQQIQDIKNIIHNHSRVLVDETSYQFENDSRGSQESSKPKSNYKLIQTRKQQLISLVSYISSYWTLYNYEQNNSKIQFIKPIQIYSIFKLLRVYTDVKFDNESQIIDIDSIEDQQIVISIVSIILSLLRYDIYVCHQSQFISQHNYNKFQQLFDSLGIVKNIKYQTINQIYEDILIQNNYTNNLTKQEQVNPPEQNNILNNKVLIFNDVDYLFGEKTLGQPFYLEEKYTSNSIKSLFQMLWGRRHQNILLNEIKLTKEYQSLFEENKLFNNFQDIIDFQIKKMIKDCLFIYNKKIFYKVESNTNKIDAQFQKKDGIFEQILKGYKTQFAILNLYDFLNLNQSENIDWEKIFNSHLYLQINVGIFSYQYLTSYFNLVLGVNTTILNNNLKNTQNSKVIQFKNMTEISSKNKMNKNTINQINKSKIYETIEDQFSEITFQIKKQIQQNNKTIVIFKNQKQLQNYQQTLQQFLSHQELYIISNDTINKENSLQQNIQQNNLILSTHQFIKEVQLIIETIDINIIKIIQTYIPTMTSDIIQTGKNNSVKYRLIVSKQQEDIEYKQITHQIWEEFINNKMTQKSEQKQIFNFIMNIIDQYSQFETKYLLKKEKQNEIYHNNTVKLQQQLSSLKNNQTLEKAQIKQLLDLQNKSSQIDSQIEDLVYGRHVGDYSNSKVDKYGNPISEELELGRSNVFQESKLIIGQFYTQGINFKKDIIPVLEKKGIKEYKITSNEEEFTQLLKNYDQAWIISGINFHKQCNENQFVEAVIQFHYSGRGLVLWTDNIPYYYHANLILQKLSFGEENGQNIQIQMVGNYYGTKILNRSQNEVKCGHFKDHFLTTGIINLYEGHTICYPIVSSNTSKENFGDLQTIGLNSNPNAKQPVLFVYEGDCERGRIIFDSGFTKLYEQYFNLTAGTSRYISNLYVYAFNLDIFES